MARIDDLKTELASVRQAISDSYGASSLSLENRSLTRQSLTMLRARESELEWSINSILRGSSIAQVPFVDKPSQRSGATPLAPADPQGGDDDTTPGAVIVPSHPVHTGDHRRYLGWSDDTSIAAIDFTTAAVFTTDVLTIPARTANGHLWFAVDADVGFPDSLIVSTNPVSNQLAFYQERVVPVMFAGVDYVVGVNPNLLSPANLVGETITLGYAAS